MMRRSFAWAAGLVRGAVVCSLMLGAGAAAARAGSLLFVGNSFTYGQGSAVHFYRADSVTDLNRQGIGGVPALFKAFTVEAGLAYDVYLETHPGVGLDWHLQHERAVLEQRPWDAVVLQAYSTLDANRPGDPTRLIADVRAFADLLRAKNPAVRIRLSATWPRADQVYKPGGAWYGKSIEAMTHDVRTGYDRAAAGTPGIAGVVPVGDAWLRAIRAGVADANPYDGIDAGKIDLWTYDGYHASAYGYYLEALMVFGSVTGRDPRVLGGNECAGFELGLAPMVVVALEGLAYEELAADGMRPAAAPEARGGEPQRCASQ